MDQKDRFIEEEQLFHVVEGLLHFVDLCDFIVDSGEQFFVIRKVLLGKSVQEDQVAEQGDSELLVFYFVRGVQ